MPTSWATTIRRTTDGVIVARLNQRSVLAFSWDDRRLVTAPVAGSDGNIEVLDWQSKVVVWRPPLPVDPNLPMFAAAEPNGTAVMVAMTSASSSPVSGDGRADQLWIVTADGSARQLLSELYYSPIFNSY